MKKLVHIIFFCCLQVAFCQKNTTKNTKSITAQASDPNAPIIQFSLTNFSSFNLYNSDYSTNLLEFQPVVPIKKLSWFPLKQLLRVTFNLQSIGNGNTGFGDIAWQHTVIPEKEDWGSWSVGYSLTIPSGRYPDYGSGKWQIGPAATFIYDKTTNWQFGAVLINSFSFTGKRNADRANVLSIQHIINYIFGKYYLGIGAVIWTYNWVCN